MEVTKRKATGVLAEMIKNMDTESLAKTREEMIKIAKQEDRDLLLKDLSRRLPYGVKAQYYGSEEQCITIDTIEGIYMQPNVEIIIGQYGLNIDEVKPYLRPMSSMTEEEIYDLAAIMTQGLPHDIDAEQGYFKVTCKELIDGLDHDIEYDFYVRDVVDGIFGIKGYDWLNEHHFDYRGLIDRGLALSTEEFNPYKD